MGPVFVPDGNRFTGGLSINLERPDAPSESQSIYSTVSGQYLQLCGGRLSRTALKRIPYSDPVALGDPLPVEPLSKTVPPLCMS